MTPKEKALELVCKFSCIRLGECYEKWQNKIIYEYQDELSALIAVDELINCTLPCCEFGGEIDSCTSEYWIQVKNEIKRL